jgi:adenylyl cyclase-associated protein
MNLRSALGSPGGGGGGSGAAGNDILSDPKFLALLTKVTSQLESLEAKVASGWRGGGTANDDDEDEGPKPAVVAFDALLSDKVAPFVAACEGLELADMGSVATGAYQGMRKFIDMASQCYKPSEMSEQQTLAKPMIDQIRKAGGFKNDARRTPTEYHWNSFTEALSGSLSWTLTSGVPGVPPPYKAIQEGAIDGAMFYVNKVRKEHKGKTAHDEWVKSLLQMLNAIRDYAKEFHKAGLTWSYKAQGAKPCSEYAGSSTPPAAAKASSMPPAARANPTPSTSGEEDGAAKAARNRTALFAQLGKIDQSSGKTAGLRSVKKDANGKKFVEDDKSNKMTAAKKARLARMRGSSGSGAGGAAKKAIKTVRPPIKELRGKKWAIENQPKGSVVQLGEDECSIKQTVYIYNCEGSTIQINGKVNTITVDKCKKTNVIFNNLMGGCELVNCKSVKVQANGTCPTVAVDKTDGVVIYAGEACYKTLSVVASKSSEMNISWPGPTADDAWLEACIPEQYQHNIDASGNVTCAVSDLYTH